MPRIEEIGIYLKGLWLIVLGRPEGFKALDTGVQGVWRSFSAILWCMPAMAVSWAAWRLFFLANMPDGSTAGIAFILKLFVVDLAAWLLPLLLIAALASPLGYADVLATIIVSTNWLSIPIFYGMAVPEAIRLVVPGSEGLTGSLSLIALVGFVIAIFRVLKLATGEQTLLASTLCALFVLPSMMIGSTLQRFFDLLPP